MCLGMLLTAACSGELIEGHPATAPTTAEPTRHEVERARPPIEPIDESEVWVRRNGERIWVAGERPRPVGAGRIAGCVIVAGDIDLCNDTKRGGVRWTADDGSTWKRSDLPTTGVLHWVVPSLRALALAVANGGDGATLFPLLSVDVSEDLGETWTTYEVPEVAGERRYTSGHVLLPDGRLLLIVGNWSGDGPRRPSGRHHGFFVSDSDDPGRLRPIEPTFSPPLIEPKQNWPCCVYLDASAAPDPVLWTITSDHRIYASVDEGRTFRELPIPWLSSSSGAAR